MRKILQKLAIFGFVISMFLPLAMGSAAVQATGGQKSTYSTESFLGLKPWYDGLMYGDQLKTPKTECSGAANCIELKTFIWTIVFNVLTDLTLIGAYLTLGFVIWGGYQYILSSGSTDKALKGKKTI